MLLVHNFIGPQPSVHVIELDDAAKKRLITFAVGGNGTERQLNQIISAFYSLCPNAN
jgi:hypothetical protein